MNTNPLPELDNDYPKAVEELEGEIARLVMARGNLLLCA